MHSIRSRASQELNEQILRCSSVATNLSGTNLDAGGARRLRGSDTSNQFRSISFSSEKHREPAKASIRGPFLVRFFATQKMNVDLETE